MGVYVQAQVSPWLIDEKKTVLPLAGTSLGVDLLCRGPYDHTCQSHMDILCRIVVYFGSAVVGVFFHLIPDEDIVFVIKVRSLLRDVVNLLVELK